jgi:uncharacterized membrane protein
MHSISASGRLWLVPAIHRLIKHWLPLFLIFFGMYNLLPFAAPVAMSLGGSSVGSLVYKLYSTQCHQMAQRSFFLFGEQPMHNLDELPLTLSGDAAKDMLKLRTFRGSETFGWKVAWSDRMVYMYGGLWFIGLLYWLLSRRRIWKPPPLWVFAMLLLPLVIDGGTHLLSDTGGLAAGFRYDNAWLAALTSDMLSAGFYRGDAFGSFNSLMCFTSGLLFAIGTGGLFLPLMDHEMKRFEAALRRKLLHYHTISAVETGS